MHLLICFLNIFLQCESEALDVNSVGFIDGTSQIVYSGSDNGVIKVSTRWT